MYSTHETGRAPLKLWDSHGPFEPQAMQQLRNIASLPFIHSHVAGMPDVHLGKGATVGSVIVRGLGNPESFHSCSHGAGRVMSRGQAKKLITLEQHAKAVRGISCRTDEGVLDESPAAYKDIGAVMAAQEDLVSIEHRLRQIINIKG